MEKGKIYRVLNRRNLKVLGYWHYFVFLEVYGDSNFLGIWLTHSYKIKKFENVRLHEDHFITVDKNNIKYEFQYSDTYFVPALLIKDSSLPISEIKGELSPSGINFIMDRIQGFTPEHYEDVYKKVFPNKRLV